MVRGSLIFALLFQSLVAICCGQLVAARTDGGRGVTHKTDAAVCCCCPDVQAVADSCCEVSESSRCCSLPGGLGCECCVLSQDTPQFPVTPDKRLTTDTSGVDIPASRTAFVHMAVGREPSLFALRHEPPWLAGRALLAGQCRWNL